MIIAIPYPWNIQHSFKICELSYNWKLLAIINWQCKIYWVLKLNSSKFTSCKTILHIKSIPKTTKKMASGCIWNHIEGTMIKLKKVNTCLASLAIEIGFPESRTLTWYAWTLLSNAFLIWSLLNLFSNTHTQSQHHHNIKD